MGSWEEKETVWERHTARRSKFAGAGHDAKPVRVSAAASIRGGRYVVHYTEADGTHGSGEETFGGIGYRFFAPIPEE